VDPEWTPPQNIQIKKMIKMLRVGRSPDRVPDEVNIFNLRNPSSRTMNLGSTQPLTEMSTRNLPGVKKQRVVGLATLPPSVSGMFENVGDLTYRKPKGIRDVYRDNFLFNWFMGSEISLSCSKTFPYLYICL
jgi:hypothetical protein